MIKIFKKESVYDATNEKIKQIEIYGLSTDTKPTADDIPDIINGTIYICVDTGDIYMYDAENKEWNKI